MRAMRSLARLNLRDCDVLRQALLEIVREVHAETAPQDEVTVYKWPCARMARMGPYSGCKWVIMVHKSQRTYQGWVARCCSSHWFYSSRHCARTCAVQHGPLQHLGFVVAHFWHGSPGALAVGSSLVVEAISGMEWDLKIFTRMHCYAIGTTSCNLVFTEVERMQ